MGVDITRLDVGGPVTAHYDTKVETDGPWLVVYDAAGTLELVVPAHAVVVAESCAGRCDRGDG